MGQTIAVTESHANRPGVVRFVTNRSFTGMGHERYSDERPPVGQRPVDEIGRRLLATGQVAGVHVYANVITVDLRKGFDAEGLKELLEQLYVYYVPGVVPPTDEEILAQMPS